MRIITFLFLLLAVASATAPSFAASGEIVFDNGTSSIEAPLSVSLIENLLEEQKPQTIELKLAPNEEISIPQWAWPAPDYDYISYGFGYRWHPVYGGTDFHNGIDIIGDYNSSIIAAKSGEVIFAGWFGGYGNCVILLHEDDLQTLYGHGAQVLVEEGDYVFIGDEIMLMGSTGVSSITHLHFGVSLNGEWVDPFDYLEN